MQVPQWAVTIPMGRRVTVGGSNWDPELSLYGGSMILTLPRPRNSFLELACSSRVYVSRFILIKCEPTSSNSKLLQVSN